MCSPRPKAIPRGNSPPMSREAGRSSMVGWRTCEERPNSSQIGDLVNDNYQHVGFLQRIRARNPLDSGCDAHSPTMVPQTQ
ncbi:hypothetical protein AB3S75_028290 [Citrus x aurantiifolia]